MAFLARHAESAAQTSLPGPPCTLSASAGATTVSLVWSPPTAGGPVSSYVIEAGSQPGGTNLANLDTGTTATRFDATSVSAGTYYIRVRAKGPAGVGAPSNEVGILLGASCSTAPTAPRSLVSSVNGSTVTLSWSPPASGVATSYVLEAGSSSGTANLAAFDTGSIGTTYSTTVGTGAFFVRVKARNGCATSAPSNEAAVTSGVLPALFSVNYDAAISAGDRILIEQAAALAQRYFAAVFRRSIAQPVTIRVFADRSGGAEYQHVVYLWTGNWAILGSFGRAKIVIHELFHVLQEEVGFPDDSAWLFEGAAEWVGYRAQTDTGAIPYGPVKDCQIRGVTGATLSAIPLSAFENWTTFSATGGSYTLASLGVDAAVGDRGALALSGLWNARSDWRSAFASAFGTSTTAFYDAFERTRRSWPTTQTSACVY